MEHVWELACVYTWEHVRSIYEEIDLFNGVVYYDNIMLDSIIIKMPVVPYEDVVDREE